MMRILFVVPYVPSLIRVRPYNLIRHLSAAGHDVTVVTLWTTPQERQDVEALQTQCHQVVAFGLPRWKSLWNCARALPSKKPLQAVYCYCAAMQRAIEETTGTGVDHYDVAHVEHLRGAIYGLGLDLPKVWDAVDCISYLFEQAARYSRSAFGRLASRMELSRTRSYEAWLPTRYDHVLATSTMDRDALVGLSKTEAQSGQNQDSPAPITVLPNGVDLAYFTPQDIPREPSTIVITGKMSYHANITAVLYFYHEVFPLVRSMRSDARLVIVGKDPSQSVARLAHDPAVTVTGYVHDLRVYLGRATVAVSPVLYGAGCQNKVLEAMAMETPMVCSSVSVRGIEAQTGRDILVADTPAAMAKSVLELLEDKSMREHLAYEARRTVETHHDWNAVVQRLQGIYDGLSNANPVDRVVIERSGEHGERYCVS